MEKPSVSYPVRKPSVCYHTVVNGKVKNTGSPAKWSTKENGFRNTQKSKCNFNVTVSFSQRLSFVTLRSYSHAPPLPARLYGVGGEAGRPHLSTKNM